MAGLDKAMIREASAWFARMHAPDADDHRAAFDAWIGADEGHRDAYSRVSEAFSLGKNLVRVPVATTPKRNRRTLASAVALMAVVIGSATLLGDLDHMPWRGRAASIGGSEPLRTRIGEIRTVPLPDGSTVILDTNSQLAIRFGSGRRDLWLLGGRARFDVAHEARAFVVHAGGGTVTAHGTVFDVQVRGDSVSVRLIRGAIDVRSSPRIGRPPEVRRITPGQAVAFGKESGLTLLPSTRAAAITQPSWPEALLDFDAVKVADLAAEANRYSAAHVIVSDPQVADMRVSGTFRAGDPTRLANRLAALLDLRVAHLPDGDVMLKKGAP